MYAHPYLATTLANDRADKFRASATAHRLVRNALGDRHSDFFSRPASPKAPEQSVIRLTSPLAVWGAS